MENYNHVKKTKLVFGKGEISSIGSLIASDGISKVLIHFGKGSIFKPYKEGTDCVYDQVVKSLKNNNVEYVDAGDQVSNPREDIAIDCFKKGHVQGCQAVLAIGGGSVYDSAKFICAMNDFADCPEKTFESAFLKSTHAKNPLPLYGVLTMSGTGSETNSSSVITSVNGMKVGGNFGVFPKISIIDPEVQYSLPAYQIQCGLFDAFCHIYEGYSGAGYLNGGAVPTTITHMCESVMRDILDSSKKALANPLDYQTRAEICFQCMIALDYSLCQGFLPSTGSVLVGTCHMISHAITNLYGVTHGAANGMVMLGLFKFFADHPDFAPTFTSMQKRLAKQVFGVSSIEESIEVLSTALQAAGLPTNLNEVINDDLEGAKDKITQQYGSIWRGVLPLSDEQCIEVLNNISQ